MRFVQLSDPHVVAARKQPVFGYDTALRLKTAVTAVNRLCPLPEFVILTGDLTNDEQESSYSLVKSILARLEVPLYLAVGNHDARVPFRRIMLGESNPQVDRIHYSFSRDGYRFIVLDSLDEGKITGSMDDPQLDWLHQTLANGDDVPTVVCLHHPPVPTGVPWMDSLMLQEANRLLAVLECHRSVRWVLCGHVHHPFFMECGRIKYLTAPSVSFQFRKKPLPTEGPARLISTEPPAFRIVDLHDEVFETSLHVISSSPRESLSGSEDNV